MKNIFVLLFGLIVTVNVHCFTQGQDDHTSVFAKNMYEEYILPDLLPDEETPDTVSMEAPLHSERTPYSGLLEILQNAEKEERKLRHLADFLMGPKMKIIRSKEAFLALLNQLSYSDIFIDQPPTDRKHWRIKIDVSHSLFKGLVHFKLAKCYVLMDQEYGGENEELLKYGMKASLWVPCNPEVEGANIITFRGTAIVPKPIATRKKLENGLLMTLDPDSPGFNAFPYFQERLMGWVNLSESQGRKLIMTGHSLGGALANRAHFTAKKDFQFEKYATESIATVTFGGPGSTRSIANTLDTVDHHYQIRVLGDPVPHCYHHPVNSNLMVYMGSDDATVKDMLDSHLNFFPLPQELNGETFESLSPTTTSFHQGKYILEPVHYRMPALSMTLSPKEGMKVRFQPTHHGREKNPNPLVLPHVKNFARLMNIWQRKSFNRKFISRSACPRAAVKLHRRQVTRHHKTRDEDLCPNELLMKAARILENDFKELADAGLIPVHRI